MKLYPLIITSIFVLLILGCNTQTRELSEEEKIIAGNLEKECEKQPDNFKCYMDLAISTRNPDYCKKIDDKEASESCKDFVETMIENDIKK